MMHKFLYFMYSTETSIRTSATRAMSTARSWVESERRWRLLLWFVCA